MKDFTASSSITVEIASIGRVASLVDSLGPCNCRIHTKPVEVSMVSHIVIVGLGLEVNHTHPTVWASMVGHTVAQTVEKIIAILHTISQIVVS